MSKKNKVDVSYERSVSRPMLFGHITHRFSFSLFWNIFYIVVFFFSFSDLKYPATRYEMRSCWEISSSACSLVALFFNVFRSALFSCVLGCQGDGRDVDFMLLGKVGNMWWNWVKLYGEFKISRIVNKFCNSFKWSQWTIKIDQPDIINIASEGSEIIVLCCSV